MSYIRTGLALSTLFLGAACGDAVKDPTNNGDMSVVVPPDLFGVKPGGFVSGAPDTHCVTDGGDKISQPTDPAVCMFKPDGGDATADYGDTRYNGVGDDDDCKYGVNASIVGVGIYQGVDTYFNVVLTNTGDGSAATGAKPEVEIFIDNHAGDTSRMTFVESPKGTYKIGPVVFDRSGQWTARFHFFESCFDYSEESPHGHAGYFVNVP